MTDGIEVEASGEGAPDVACLRIPSPRSRALICI